MASNQLFPDWVTGDLITAAKLNQMKNDLIPWAQLGQANGPASLDSAGKLAQPRRVLYVSSASATSTLSTTSAPGAYFLPEPRITLTASGSRILAIATARLYGDTNHVYGAVMALAYSTDGGSTWTEFSKRIGAFTNTNLDRSTVTSAKVFTPTAGQQYTIGIMLGANAGTVYVDYGFVDLLVMEVDF